MSCHCSFRWILAAAVAVAAVAPVPAHASVAAPVVRAVRHSSTPGQSRVVVDLSAPARFTVASDSLGLALSILDAVPGEGLRTDRLDTGVVRSIEVKRLARDVVILIQGHGPLSSTHFELAAADGKPHRVVLDLTPLADAAVVSPSLVANPNADPSAPAPREPAASPPSIDAPRRRPFVVAVDAGHGGHDAGALGKYGLVEKKLCLDVARRAAAILNRQGNIRAVLTRDDDVFLSLPERNAAAEKMGADVFVSIHMNSAPSSSARGAEIFFVAPAGAERAASNAMSSGEAAEEFGSDDGNIVHMLLDVNQQAVLARSELLADAILSSVRDRRLLPTRSVKQKSFSVLRTISMPSVLVESGFITNTADAKLLREPDGREKIARAVADGVIEFFRVHPPQRMQDDSVSARVYRVQSGDTLWTISRRYQTTVARLRELNGLSSRDELRVGQELVLPTAR